MKHDDTIRAWRDDDFRSSLTERQRLDLPDSPVGIVELPEEDSETIGGAFTGPVCATVSIGLGVSQFFQCNLSLLEGTCHFLTLGCCPA